MMNIQVYITYNAKNGLYKCYAYILSFTIYRCFHCSSGLECMEFQRYANANAKKEKQAIYCPTDLHILDLLRRSLRSVSDENKHEPWLS